MTATIFACCAITLSTLVLGLHYGIDDLAGLVWIFPISLIARSTLPRETAS
jgi:membrane-associated phospholipid phosphatase